MKYSSFQKIKKPYFSKVECFSDLLRLILLPSKSTEFVIFNLGKCCRQRIKTENIFTQTLHEKKLSFKFHFASKIPKENRNFILQTLILTTFSIYVWFLKKCCLAWFLIFKFYHF